MELTLTRRDLSHWDERTHGWVVEPGALEVSVGRSSRDLPLATSLDLVAPRKLAPLALRSTIGEWLEQPEAGAALTSALGEFGEMFGPDSEDPMQAAFMLGMPVVKVPLMGMAETLTVAGLQELVARYGEG